MSLDTVPVSVKLLAGSWVATGIFISGYYAIRVGEYVAGFFDPYSPYAEQNGSIVIICASSLTFASSLYAYYRVSCVIEDIIHYILRKRKMSRSKYT